MLAKAIGDNKESDEPDALAAMAAWQFQVSAYFCSNFIVIH